MTLHDRLIESVWDYPRPPRVEPSTRRVLVEHAGVVIVDTVRSVRVLETSHPPVYYVPREDVAGDVLVGSSRRTTCEFKGVASYWHVAIGGLQVAEAAWSYEDPSPGYEHIRGMIAFYPGKVDRCSLDDEAVVPQQGSFYGGWITSEIVGPLKGGPGTSGW